MTKKIAVQNGLDDIKKNLENLGYTIVDMDSSDAEAIVYMRTEGDGIPYISSSVNMNTRFDIENQSSAILINAEGRSIEDIDEIIKKRRYTPLF
ncbi:YkuS family protein [Anaerosalibacter massiliensis]|uniref:YkuS family protein n=1 Tax=Anaerosalibacter massiliensis TaxID=1347392 RepID=A0A9X2MK05_9FIRM|nr:YkuS family protein [Anaerosalibacter massiliensis]MCR2045470.1 YkuS family protein [Anaerosalibacter massiliensis]